MSSQNILCILGFIMLCVFFPIGVLILLYTWFTYEREDCEKD